MVLDLILDILSTYLPLSMGMIYLYSYQKIKIQNLIKFFVLRSILTLLEFLFVKLFMFSPWLIHYSMIPLYLYLSIYSYAYAAIGYDILMAPLGNFFIEYHQDLLEKVENEKRRIKVLEEHGKIKIGEVGETDFMGKIQKMVYRIFNIENMYLLK